MVTAEIFCCFNWAKRRCKLSTSGVVKEPPRFSPLGRIVPKVPMVAHDTLFKFNARATQLAHEVLPFVPVIAITATLAEGWPYHSSAS